MRRAPLSRWRAAHVSHVRRQGTSCGRLLHLQRGVNGRRRAGVSALVDVVFRGEADVSFPHFVDDYLAAGARRECLDGLPLSSYPGLVTMRNGSAFAVQPIHHSESELAVFPPPDRSDFDHRAYQAASIARVGEKVASVITTYGCPFACDFCSKPVFGDTVRHRDLDGVFAEIDELRHLGYDAVWVADDTFTLRRVFVEDFCRRVRSRGMTWSCLSRASGVDADLASLMAASGCRHVYLGLESGCPATLALMNKRATVAEGVRATQIYHEAGIAVGAFFMVGYPGEDVAAIEETFALALELPLDEISFNVPMPLPGSRLYERLGGRDATRDWTHENEITFVYDSEVDEVWLRRRVDETLAVFAERRAILSASA